MKKIVSLLMTVFVVFLVVSCKNQQDGVKDSQAVENANIGGSITIYSLKDDTLCPILTDNEANRQMLGIVYESLVRLKSNMEPEGVLATGWSVSADGLVWTFDLRENVKWHNNDSLSAEDVVYTVNQIKSSPESSYFYNVSRISGAEAVGKNVVFTLFEPCSTFVNLMTFPIIKAQEEEIDRFAYFPCGTGAYVFSDKNEGNMYYLLRNDSWWGGQAKLDEVRVKLLPDSETVMYSFSAGDIDIANTEWGQWGRFVSDGDVRTSACAVSVYDFVGLNHKNKALANKEVRKAINLAVKRDKIVNDIFAGNAARAISPIRDDWYISGEQKSEYKSDSGSAERLLLKNEWKKSGGVYGKKVDGATQELRFDLIVNEENSSRMNIAESIKLDLEGIGMEINVIPLPYEEYEGRIISGEYELFIGSTMISDEMDYSFLLGEGNMFGYEDKTMSRILGEIKTAQGREKIIESYTKLKNRFAAEIPFIGICFENFDMLYSDRVKGELNSSPSSIYDGIYNLYVEN